METLTIEWKHLDVAGETCDRCSDTGKTLATEIEKLNNELNPKGIQVRLLETKLDDSKIAESNSVLINGAPIEGIIELTVMENSCASCGDLLGKDTNCRTLIFEGLEYNDIPAKAIRKAVYKVLGIAEPVNILVHTCNCGCC